MHLSTCIIIIIAPALLWGMVLAQEYTLTPIAIRKCKIINGEELNYDVQLKTHPDGSKSLSFKAEVPKVLDDSCTYTVHVEMLSGPVYIHYMQTDGNVCEALKRLVDPAWQRFKSSIKPPLKESCKVEPGSYSIEGFQTPKDEVNIPIPSKGDFRVRVQFYCQNVELACVEGEIKITEDE